MPQEAVIKSRVAVRHYGVKASSIYHEDEDAGQHKWWDEYFAAYRVMKMTWYIETVCSLWFPLCFCIIPILAHEFERNKRKQERDKN
jgi:hypothetical protein